MSLQERIAKLECELAEVTAVAGIIKLPKEAEKPARWVKRMSPEGKKYTKSQEAIQALLGAQAKAMQSQPKYFHSQYPTGTFIEGYSSFWPW